MHVGAVRPVFDGDRCRPTLRRRQPEPEPETPRLDPELARKLLEPIPYPATFPGVAPPDGKTTRFEQQKCQHCLGLHTRACPRVAEIEYHEGGSVKRVVYWPHGAWPEELVLWLEDVQEAAGE